MELEIKLSGRKPPLHPGLRWYDRCWIAKHLRANAQDIEIASIAFVNLAQIYYKLKMERWFYDPDLVLDLAQLVLTKYHSTPSDKRHQYDRSLHPNQNSPYYLADLSSMAFAHWVQSACNVKDVWWTYDFTPHLLRLLKTNKSTAAPNKKLNIPSHLCVDHGPLPVDAKNNKLLERPFVDHHAVAVPFKKQKIT